MLAIGLEESLFVGKLELYTLPAISFCFAPEEYSVYNFSISMELISTREFSQVCNDSCNIHTYIHL